MRKLIIGCFFIFFSCFGQTDREKKVNQPVNVLIEFTNINSIPIFKLTFINTSNEDYTINEDLYSCIKIENRVIGKDSWIQNNNWVESENTISGENWGYLDADGNFEKQNFEDILNYMLVVPAKAKVIKNISCNFIATLIDDKREVRFRFKYDTNYLNDITDLRKSKIENIESPVFSGYYYIKK
jgi:hypothetical protein